jgi:hypothetical protein
MDLLFPRIFKYFTIFVFQISQALFKRKSRDMIEFDQYIQKKIIQEEWPESGILFAFMSNVKRSIDDIMELKGLTKLKNPKHLDLFHKNMRYIMANADTFFEGSLKEEEHKKFKMGMSVREFISQARKNFKIICTFRDTFPASEFLMIKESFIGFQHLLDAEINYLCNVLNQTS